MEKDFLGTICLFAYFTILIYKSSVGIHPIQCVFPAFALQYICWRHHLATKEVKWWMDECKTQIILEWFSLNDTTMGIKSVV